MVFSLITFFLSVYPFNTTLAWIGFYHIKNIIWGLQLEIRSLEIFQQNWNVCYYPETAIFFHLCFRRQLVLFSTCFLCRRLFSWNGVCFWLKWCLNWSFTHFKHVAAYEWLSIKINAKNELISELLKCTVGTSHWEYAQSILSTFKAELI